MGMCLKRLQLLIQKNTLIFFGLIFSYLTIATIQIFDKYGKLFKQSFSDNVDLPRSPAYARYAAM